MSISTLQKERTNKNNSRKAKKIKRESVREPKVLWAHENKKSCAGHEMDLQRAKR